MSLLVWAIILLILSALSALFGFGFLSGAFGCCAKGMFIIFLVGFALTMIARSAPEDPNDEDIKID